MCCGNLITVKILSLFTLTIISFVLLFLPVTTVLAEDASPSATEVVYEKVNPNDGFSYLTKRFGEKIKLILFSVSANSKENFYKELVNRRLAELKFIIDNKDVNNFEIATIRYSTTVGEWTEHILAKKLDDKKKPAIEVLSTHTPVVEQLMQGFDGTTAEWRFVKQDADYIKIYSAKLEE